MLDLYFITSNNEKLAHARYLSRAFNIKILKKKNYGIGYEEPRIKDRELLLNESIRNAYMRFQKNVSNPDSKFFFIEDTSVIIEALSNKNEEIPGVDIKYWMKEHSFSEINELLIQKGNNRKVRVRSDIILWLALPLREKYNKDFLHFHDDVEGEIISAEVNDIITRPYYPWLNNKTFNKWFVPKGALEPLSKLNIKEADKYDFRGKTFEKMLGFFEKEGLIKKRGKNSGTGLQLGFNNPAVFIICGPTCAGKSTIANYLQEHFAYYHIEASDFMYLNFYEQHGANSNINIGDFAFEALNSNKRIVVDRIIDHLETINHVPLVITGFRAQEEIIEFKKSYTGKWNIEEIWIETEFLKRFNRYLNRGRDDKALTEQEFQARDNLQRQMGLMTIKQMYDDKRIIPNNGSFDDYYEEFEKRFQNTLSHSRGIDKINKRKKLEIAILKALLTVNPQNFYTTTEITRIINLLPEYSSSPKNKNNVSRYFNQDFHPYYEIKVNEENTLTYRLTNTGISMATWISQI